jgi:phosphopantetheinyl transferase
MFMGIDIDEERFAALPEFFARQFCPFCACEHSWLKKDSKLVDRRRAMRRGIQQAS